MPSSASGGGFGLDDILGALMGSGNLGATSPLAPMANALAKKLGLPPVIAQMVMAFVMSKLLTGQRGGAPAIPSGLAAAAGGQASQGQGLDLDALLSQMDGPGVGQEYVQATGLAQELSARTGLDPETASRSLAAAFGVLGDQRAAGKTTAARTTAKRAHRSTSKR